MVEVKIYRVSGKMLIRHDRLPTWQKFSVEVRALKPEDAIEKVLSELGSRHKLRRRHIRIEEVREISLEEATNPQVRALAKLERWII